MTRDSRNLDGPFVFDGERSASQAEIGTRNASDTGQPGPGWRQEVEGLRTMVQDYALAHDTRLVEIRRLRQENRALRGQLDATRAKIVQLARQVFGRKSERQGASAPPSESAEAGPDGASAPQEPTPPACGPHGTRPGVPFGDRDIGTAHMNFRGDACPRR